jgi:D-galactarolactone cycloisomerase
MEKDLARIAFSFREFISRRAMDIVQPDLCAAGRITECKKIPARLRRHTESSACRTPRAPRSTSPPEERGGILFSHKEGVVKVPAGPGLGIEINREILKRYKVA